MTNDPTPEEIKERRISLHRAKGEFADAKRILESPDYANLIPEEEESEPQFKTIYEIGLSSRVAVPLEKAGIMFAGELCGYTVERLRLFKEFGDGSIAEIRKRLADLGLSLRKSVPGEIAPPLPKPIQPPRHVKRTPKLSDKQVDRIFELIAFGNSQRRTARLMDICRWTVWNRLRLFKVKVRALYEMGATDSQVRHKLGENRWSVWCSSLTWDRTKKHARAA